MLIPNIDLGGGFVNGAFGKVEGFLENSGDMNIVHTV